MLFIAITAGFAVFFWRTQAEYTQYRIHENKSLQRLQAAELKLKEHQHTLERLRTDPAYVELIVRRRLGYAKPDETVFRFDP